MPTINFTVVVGTVTNSGPPTLTLLLQSLPLKTYTATITPTSISCTGFTGVGHGPLVIKDNVMEWQ